MTELGKQIKQSLIDLTNGMGGRLSSAQEDEIKRVLVLVDELDGNYEALRTAVLEKPA